METWLIQHLLVTGLLVLIVWFVQRTRRLSPATLHLLWVMVLVKLLTPSVVAWPWKLEFPQVMTAAVDQSAESELTDIPINRRESSDERSELTHSERSNSSHVSPAAQESGRVESDSDSPANVTHELSLDSLTTVHSGEGPSVTSAEISSLPVPDRAIATSPDIESTVDDVVPESTIISPDSLVHGRHADEAVSGDVLSEPSTPSGRQPVATSDTQVTGALAPQSASRADAHRSVIDTPKSSSRPLTILMLIIWTTGIGITLIRLTRQVGRWRRVVAESDPGPDWLVGEVARVAEQVGCRPPRSVITDAITAPCLLAVGRPLLLWPQGMAVANNDAVLHGHTLA